MNKNSRTAFDKNTHTILIPDLFPIHMDFLADALCAAGYRAEVLKTDGRAVLDTGLKYLHNDMCYPAICSVGQQLHAVTCGKYDTHKIALLQFQTGGGCRASNYGMLLKKALRHLKLDYIPVITIGFSAANLRSSGLKITPKLIAAFLAALTYGDLLMLLKNQVRPYELHRGDTQHLVHQWQETLHAELRSKGATLSRVKENLQRMVQDFSNIRIEKTPKLKVGIVGEVYVKYSPLGNNHLEDFLDTQDCEYMLPGVLGFIHYCLSNTAVDYALYGGSRIQRDLSRILEGVIAKYESLLTRAVEKAPRFVAPASFQQMRKNGSRLLSPGVKMGEGWYLPAEMVELVENGYSNIICAQPFGCLPNHIVGKGIIRRFRELYPQANICPIDYDASSSAVNQENRLRLMLALAREKAGIHTNTAAPGEPAAQSS